MEKSELEKEVTVIIVGAGLSGLSAADHLLRNSGDRKINIIILEAMDRIGGKSYTKQIRGTKFDLGAQFIGKTQKYAIELANRAKQQFLPQNDQGSKVLYLNGQRSTYKSDIPSNVNIFALIQLQFCMWKINRMAKKVSTLNPKDCEMGTYWDSITVQTWIQKNIWSQKVRLLVEAAVRVLLGSQLSQVSFLYFLWFIHQNQSFQNLITVKNGLQEKKLKNGTQQLSFFLNKQILTNGGMIYLNTKVTQIEHLQNNKIRVHTSSLRMFLSNFLIMANGPSIYRKITFKPTLSSQRNYMAQKSFVGRLTKVVLLYEKQYWKQKGYSGQIVCDGFDNPIISSFDDTKYDDNGEIKQPALIVFVGAQVYRYWKQKGKDIMRTRLSEKIAEAFQCQEMKNPLEVQWYEFDEQQTLGGGPVGVMGPGLLSHIQNLRKPQNNIHFAGTQTASVSIGYMDGAIQSGIRAANQILQKIKTQTTKLQQNKKSSQEQQPLLSKDEKPWYNNFIRNTKRCFQWF